jgi:hypothetical protein
MAPYTGESRSDNVGISKGDGLKNKKVGGGDQFRNNHAHFNENLCNYKKIKEGGKGPFIKLSYR